MNVKQLKDEADRLRLEASTKRKQADRFTYNAEDYEKAEDTEKAEIERTEAAKLIAEAEEAERNAQRHDQGALEQETRAIALDQEQSALQQDFDQKMKDIERRKAELRGGVGLFS